MLDFWIPLFTSVIVSAVLVITKSKHLKFTGAGADTSAVQASHTVPTPRIGGLAVMAGMVSGVMFDLAQGHTLYLILLLTGLPMFLTGLGEDLFRHISTKVRYLATVVSAAIAIWATGIWITTADSYGLEWAFALPPLAILITLFVVASYCHAFNLIDGLNGLASGTGILIAVGLAGIAVQAGQQEIVSMCMITAVSIAGFFLFNFPFGRLFLGDSGAYIIGYMLTWTGLVILHLEPATSTWALFLIFFWPLADTLFAIYRRLSRGVSLDTADRLHFHQVVLRGLEIFFLGRNKRRTANPLATSVLLPVIAVPVFTGVYLWNNPLASFLALVFFGFVFVLSYRISIRTAQARLLRPGSKQENTRILPAE
ncbi:glycosyltransferase family 4 protein [Pseudophaeobacter arcticus]|jgi:UDP-GlcNAc:undecaprenyl-phosphate GlcNAc-1-phosphate transferase|uniref:glycosyltransferase family 4 protein n=1 Tax=Pseudophaeobacter arcticus TaxID=385492 RepID=UPI0039E42A7E